MGKTSNESKAKYNRKAYDTTLVYLKKGQKDAIKEHADKQGLSVNGYINQLIERDMKDGKH